MNMNGILKRKVNKAICAIMLFAVILIAPAPVAAYAADYQLSIPVKQVFTTSSPSADASFTYALKPLDAACPVPAHGSPGSLSAEGYTFPITGTGDVQIGPMDCVEYSIYRYEVYQVIGTEKPGYTYDRRRYTIEAHIGTPKGVETVIFNQDGTKTESIVFENDFTVLPSDPKLMTDPPVKKTVSGNPRNNSAFTFRLSAQDPSSPMPAGSVNGMKTITITGSGEGEFGAWSYTKAGTYYYTVSEVNTGEHGYTYDTMVYTITDTVREENGRLVLSRVVTNNYNKQVTTMAFINSYSLAGDGPKTGDDANTTLYTALLIGCGALAIGMAAYLAAGRKRKAKQNAGRKGAALVAVLALFIGIGAAAYSGSQLLETKKAWQEADAAYESISGRVKVSAETAFQTSVKSPAIPVPKLDIDFEALKVINSDAAAWLYCPGTVIDYPVMEADDYSYYLSHLPDGTHNANGTLFIDYNCAPDFSGRLTVVYGHHMKSGRMFGSIVGYKDQGYYDEHPYMYLYTESGNYRIDLMYGCVIGAGQWRERAFMYEENTDALIAYAAHNTTFASGAGYEEGDRIIALSTCSYEFDNARYVVVGKLRAE